ncbi:MAG: DapH/DapD/GlmU-related protein [Oscillospiraceae bacterium]|nr:DapH/DapD/GlmU-related protein [Oscillospiraceae bacterium]
MAERSAVIFIPDDTAKTGLKCPLMLYPVMGSPLLSWLVRSLEQAGTERFFLVCHARYRDLALGCFRDSAQVSISDSDDTPDLLHVFLSTADEQEQTVAVITGPAVLLQPQQAAAFRVPGRSVPSCVFAVGREALMDALDDSFDFVAFLQTSAVCRTDADGFFTIASIEDLLSWQPAIQRQSVLELIAAGVTVWDAASCYVSPLSAVAPGAELLPGAIVRGRTSIGEDCVIGPNALLDNVKLGAGCTVNASQLHDCVVGRQTAIGPFAVLRPGCKIGDHSRLGNFVEVSNSSTESGVSISRLAYLGDADVGKNCSFGGGAVTADFDRAQNCRTTVGDDCFIGCNTSLIAPVTLSPGAYAAAGTTVTDDVPAQALAIGRARQTNRRDWAAKNKIRE